MNRTSIFTDNRGLNFSFIHQQQNLISMSKNNVLRGIHVSPYKKKITVLKGSIVDYIIDIKNKTYKNFILDSSSNNVLEIPENYGHLFYTTQEETYVLYNLDGEYDDKLDKTYNYQDPELNLDICKRDDFIISDKDRNAPFIQSYDYLILGSSGFLGSYMYKQLLEQKKSVIPCKYRLSQINDIKNSIKKFNVKYVICGAGISGKPSISWCDENKYQTYHTNLVNIIELCDICDELKVHITIFGSGSVYLSTNDNETFSEHIICNNFQNFYCKCRILLEELINEKYKNVLYLRIQYPITFDNNEKCFFSKIKTRLHSIDNVPINITFLPNLFDKITILCENNKVGIFNFVNPGHIYIKEIIEIYNRVYNTNIKYSLRDKNVFCGLLNTKKIENEFKLTNIHNSIEEYLKKVKNLDLMTQNI